jgi:hypothetical protein
MLYIYSLDVTTIFERMEDIKTNNNEICLYYLQIINGHWAQAWQRRPVGRSPEEIMNIVINDSFICFHV